MSVKLYFSFLLSLSNYVFQKKLDAVTSFTDFCLFLYDKPSNSDTLPITVYPVIDTHPIAVYHVINTHPITVYHVTDMHLITVESILYELNKHLSSPTHIHL